MTPCEMVREPPSSRPTERQSSQNFWRETARAADISIPGFHACSTDNDGRRAAMIANRDVFVIRQQRVVRTEELAHVGCVIDGRIEIGVVADHYREMHRNIRR